METFVSLTMYNMLTVSVLPFEKVEKNPEKGKRSLTHNDVLLTFDLVVVIDFFVLLIDQDKMQQIRAKSDVV